MKALKLLFISIIIITAFNSCSNDSSKDLDSNVLNALDIYEELNISYGNESDQVFDLYLPFGRTPDTKTLILVHGGGWTSGDKADMDGFREFIIEQIPDYAVVNMNYRLAAQDNQVYPMQINDITSVVNFLRNNQETYFISDDIGFVGVSASAHLSLLWSYAFDTENQTDMVCSVVGPTNFTDPSYLNNTDPVLQEIIDTFELMPQYHF